MTRYLELGDGFRIPEDAVTESFALLAKKGAGKSNAAVRMAEEMYRLGLPWVAIDPKGDWWGMRAGPKGGHDGGLPLPVLGGFHGDLPLEPESGELVADLIVDQNLTCVLDVSDFPSKAKQVRFLTDFGARLYQRHGRDPEPRHLFLEEADDYLPQRFRGEMAVCVGQWTKIVKMGRQRGLGITLVSQRSAVVNKDALSQTETLIALRTPDPRDKKQIESWVVEHDAAVEVLESLPSLENGEAWVISPHWLGITMRVKFGRRETFDSGATPKVGQKRKTATMRDLDLDDLAQQMSDVVKRAEENDPTLLQEQLRDVHADLGRTMEDLELARQEIDRLKRDRAELAEEVEELRANPVVQQVEVVDVAVVDGLRSAADTVCTVRDQFAEPLELLESTLMDLAKTASAASELPPPPPTRAPQAAPRPLKRTSPLPASRVELDKGPRKVLETMARHHPVLLTQSQIGQLAGYTVSGGAFQAHWRALKQADLIAEDRNAWECTALGLDVAGVEPANPTSTEEVVEMWCKAMDGEAARRILRLLVDCHPATIPVDRIAETLGYTASGGSFQAHMRTLVRNGLAEKSKAGLKAGSVLFVEERS